MGRTLLLGAVLLAFSLHGLAADEPPTGVACLLGWPGLAEHPSLFTDGSVLLRPGGPRLREWLAAPGAWEWLSPQAGGLRFAWLKPGVRAVRVVGEAGGLELTSVTGIAPYGRPTPSPWLFRTLVVTNRRPQRAAGRLGVVVGSGPAPLTLRRDRDLVEGDLIRLVTSRPPASTKTVADTGELILAYEYDLAPKGSLDLVLCAPVGAVAYQGPDWTELHQLTSARAEDALASAWQAQVVPDTLTAGNELVNQAYHAAVAGLLLNPPPPEAPAASVAAWVGAIARCGQGPAAAALVERVIQRQTAQGSLAPDLADHAALTRALAETVLFSDAPAQWAPILWPAISRAVVYLAGHPEASHSVTTVRAISRAAEVARLAGHSDSAAKWIRSSGEVPSVAWPALESELKSQLLPGVRMNGDTEDVAKAEELVLAVADSVAQGEEGRVLLFPGLPLSWRAEGLIVELRQFPSGAGPLSLKLTSDRAGRKLTLASLVPPRDAAALLLNPPLGTQATALHVNGKALKPEVLAQGPPWAIAPQAEKITLDLK